MLLALLSSSVFPSHVSVACILTPHNPISRVLSPASPVPASGFCSAAFFLPASAPLLAHRTRLCRLSPAAKSCLASSASRSIILSLPSSAPRASRRGASLADPFLLSINSSYPHHSLLPCAAPLSPAVVRARWLGAQLPCLSGPQAPAHLCPMPQRAVPLQALVRRPRTRSSPRSPPQEPRRACGSPAAQTPDTRPYAKPHRQAAAPAKRAPLRHTALSPIRASTRCSPSLVCSRARVLQGDRHACVRRSRK